MNRRDFIKLTGAAAGLSPLASGCLTSSHKITGSIIGASAAAGHQLRDKTFTEPVEYHSVKTLIVGGGVSGLSAARFLTLNNDTDFLVLDLEKNMGGNAASGGNSISQFPWGAHYIPIPNNDLPEYHSFLEECNVITGKDENGLPVYNEFYLCHDPEERLYINGSWQEGLVPKLGLNSQELKEFSAFFHLMDSYRHSIGSDGKDAFAIPVNNSSKDDEFVSLDNITMKEWLDDKGFKSKYIRWYINYCTRDDFGTMFDEISAWAGIHYFAARKGKGANAEYHDVLTWEQGNGFLVQQLKKNLSDKLWNNALVVSVKNVEDGVRISYFDVHKKKLMGIHAQHCIIAAPQFIAARLLADELRIKNVNAHLHYVPWMVANLTVNSTLQERNGIGRSWDNVIFESNALGYVDATHQQLQQRKEKRNLTYYWPLTDKDPLTARREAQKITHEEWVEKVIADLKIIHPNIASATENMDIIIWGHAMAQPLPGLIHGKLRSELSTSISNAVHFAHTDLAGISIFEEAFYQGFEAAKKVLNKQV